MGVDQRNNDYVNSENIANFDNLIIGDAPQLSAPTVPQTLEHHNHHNNMAGNETAGGLQEKVRVAGTHSRFLHQVSEQSRPFDLMMQ